MRNQAVGNWVVASSAHWWDRSVSRSACGDTPMPRLPKAATGDGIRLRTGNRKDALAASGRGAIEEGGMPVSTNRASFKRRQRRGSDPDHDNANCHDDERHDRVHHDAERAMIGIGGDRMHKRHVDNRQQHQQDQAQPNHRPQSVWLWVEIPS